ncbi:TPA: hypothetical protein DCW54_01910 [Candidatus Dependentiae bacterium]|nr:hypothetical protein [Candidatus Dependentiae bacterium]
MKLVIKVVPRASRQGFAPDGEVGVKCYVQAPPEGGKANKELIKLLAKKLRIPQSSVVLLYGGGTRVKMFELPFEIEQAELIALLLSEV